MAVQYNSFDEIMKASEGKGIQHVLQTATDQMAAAKKAVQSGQMTLGQYVDLQEAIIQPAVPWANHFTTQGAKAANVVTPYSSEFAKYVKDFKGFGQSGYTDIKLPFTEREFNQLPANVLPTQDEVSSGMFKKEWMPSQRFFDPQTGEVEKVADTGGIRHGTTDPAIDEGKLVDEATYGKTEREQLLEQQKAEKAQYLQELSTLLTQQSDRQFQEALPGMYEDLNTRGLLRSSALGDRMSTEQAKLASQVSEQLGMQGLADRQWGTEQGSGILEAYLGGREGAIGRRFSMEDYQRQVEDAIRIGATNVPNAPQSNTKGNTAQGAMGGASMGSGFGSWGTLAGGAAGAYAGHSKS